MNDNFVIENKWNLSVGLFLIDNTQKLIRHFEHVASLTQDITIDLYENGLVNINLQNKTPSGSGSASAYVDPTNPFARTTIFSINITNGQKMSDTYIKMIEAIYKPYCEKINTNANEFKRRYEVEYDENNPDHLRWFGEPNYTRPLICGGGTDLITHTVELLKNLKEIYCQEQLSRFKYMYNYEKSKYEEHKKSVFWI